MRYYSRLQAHPRHELGSPPWLWFRERAWLVVAAAVVVVVVGAVVVVVVLVGIVVIVVTARVVPEVSSEELPSAYQLGDPRYQQARQEEDPPGAPHPLCFRRGYPARSM